MGSQRVGHDWATELNWTEWALACFISILAAFSWAVSWTWVKRGVALSILEECVHAKWLQSCPTLCDPMDHSPPGSYVHGILQAKTVEQGCHFLLQGIFHTQRWNLRLLCLLHHLVGSLPLVPPGKPVLEGREQIPWVKWLHPVSWTLSFHSQREPYP